MRTQIVQLTCRDEPGNLLASEISGDSRSDDTGTRRKCGAQRFDGTRVDNNVVIDEYHVPSYAFLHDAISRVHQTPVSIVVQVVHSIHFQSAARKPVAGVEDNENPVGFADRATCRGQDASQLCRTIAAYRDRHRNPHVDYRPPARCRAASYRTTVPAFAAFRELAEPDIGMRTM